jgi:hypothetical protein
MAGVAGLEPATPGFGVRLLACRAVCSSATMIDYVELC